MNDIKLKESLEEIYQSDYSDIILSSINENYDYSNNDGVLVKETPKKIISESCNSSLREFNDIEDAMNNFIKRVKILNQ